MADVISVPTERIAMMLDLMMNGNTENPDVIFVLVMCTKTTIRDRVKATVLSNVEEIMAEDILKKAVSANRFHQ